MSSQLELERLWKEYQSGIKSFLHSKVGNPHDVEDLQQEILIKTYQNLNNVQSADSIKSWLYQIARNSIIDFYRTRSRGQNLQAEDLWYEEQDIDLKHELSQCILPFIQALPKENAELLTAIDIEGQSQKHYAEASNLSYSTLKSRVQKSRQLLKSQFQECCTLTLDKRGNLIDCDSETGECGSC